MKTAAGVLLIAGLVSTGHANTAATAVNGLASPAPGAALSPPTRGWPVGRDVGRPATTLSGQSSNGLAPMPPMPSRGGLPTAAAAPDQGSRAMAPSNAWRSGPAPPWNVTARDTLAPALSMPSRASLPMALSAVPRTGIAPLQSNWPSGRATALSALASDGVVTAKPPSSGSVALPAPSTATQQGVVAVAPIFSKGNIAGTTLEDVATGVALQPGDGAVTAAFFRSATGSAAGEAVGMVRVGYESRSQQVNRLVLANPRLLERDPLGAPVLRREITLLLPEQAQLPEAFLDRGFTTLREADVLGRHLVVLRAPPGLSLAAALELARQLAPQAEADFNHLMTGSGQAGATQKLPVQTIEGRAEAEPRELVRVGLIDEPVGPAPDLAGVRVEARNCSAVPASGHGTAVAAVLARAVREGGGKAVLYTADLRCGHGAVDAIATALQAMASERVPVVNLSAVGPHNRVLAAVVARFLARGHLLVAAVGNDGPAAPPLYPAAYPGVIAVTGVDRQGRVLMEAGAGDHVMFAAPGIVDVDATDGTSRVWRGTSFAAPAVAATLALRLAVPDVQAAAAVVSGLVARAVDAGDAGRDRVYGFGVVGPRPASVAGLR